MNQHPSRNRNLGFILKWWHHFRPDAKIIVVEQKTETDLTHLPFVEHIKLKHDHGYSRSMGFNEGIKTCDDGIHVLADNDCILHPDVMKNIEKDMEGTDYFIPYHWCHNLSEQETQGLCSGQLPYGHVKGSPRGHQNEGGIVMIKDEAYEKVGGFDPGFIGWGCEDSAFRVKCQKLVKMTRGKGVMHHLNHTVEYAKGQNPEYKKNNQLWGKIRNMSKEQTEDYIKSIGTKHFRG